VPLETARLAAEVAEWATRAVEVGNPNTLSDAASGAWLARAAGEGALLNVQINLQSLTEGADKQAVEIEAGEIARRLSAAAGAATTAAAVRLSRTA
jgi:formiminotetrahydrofolate cyclodeaminase